MPVFAHLNVHNWHQHVYIIWAHLMWGKIKRSVILCMYARTVGLLYFFWYQFLVSDRARQLVW